MGAVAAEYSDFSVITSDNPRTEDPDQIIREIREGISKRQGSEVAIEPDRRRAIELALESATSQDVVLIAGKGHEKTQTIGTTTTPFSDQTVAAQILSSINTRRDGGAS